MCFNNNVVVTFQLIEKDNQIIPIFTEWFANMKIFKREPELRRIIFGLNAILRIQDPQALPQVVQQQAGAIGKELVNLVDRVDTVRRKTLKQNEDHVAKGGFESESDSDGEMDMGNEEEVF